MNILFIVPYVPNLIRVRSYNFIRKLANRGHQITVATLWSNDTDLKDIEHLREFGVNVEAVQLPVLRSVANSLLAVTGGKPLQANYSWQPKLAEKINSLFANRNGHFPFDVVHIEHLRGVRYGLSLKAYLEERYGYEKPTLIWDSVDCISYLFRQAAKQSKSQTGRLMTRVELKRTEKYEAWLANQFEQILISSPKDLDEYINLVPDHLTDKLRSKICVVPNGVDLKYFYPDPDVERDPATLIVTGKMSYHANVTMVVNLKEEIMPFVWEKNPEIKLEIVGKDPTRRIQAMGEHPQVTVTGTVADIRPYLRRASVALAPTTYGAGSQLKVLEAMACGTPVVATPRAVSALTAVSGQDVLVGDNPAQLSKLILQIIRDKQQNRMIGDNGYRYVAEHHDWAKIVAGLEDCYQALNGG